MLHPLPPSYRGEKADLFQLGVILFMLVMRHPPFNQATAGDPFYSMVLNTEIKRFWASHLKLRKENKFPISKSFAELVLWMLQPDPDSRPTIKQIR